MSTSESKRGGWRNLARSWGGLVLAAGVIAAGCGDDDPPAASPPPVEAGGASGSGATGGTAGSAGAGAAGTGGTGNADAGPDSSMGTGGTSGAAGTGGATGGSAGTATGGTSGSSGSGGSSGSSCGNGTKDPGEQCDDHNTTNGDGCSASCVDTARCAACDTAYCKAAGDADYDLAVDKCANDTTPSSDGPAAGRKKNELCTELLTCMRNSNCSLFNDIARQARPDCYCGTLGSDECKASGAQPNGPCKKEIEAAGESRTLDTLFARATAFDFALGRAGFITQVCDGSACFSECRRGEPGDTCLRCSLGPGAIYRQPSCATSVLCYYSNSCLSIVECAHKTDCALSGAQSCYGDGSGPCATQITTAAGSTDPATVRDFMTSTQRGTDVYYAIELLNCQAAQCATACFPAPDSGTSAVQ